MTFEETGFEETGFDETLDFEKYIEPFISQKPI